MTAEQCLALQTHVAQAMWECLEAERLQYTGQGCVPALERLYATLEQTKLQASGVELTGRARAEAEKALQLAPVQAQIELAKEIGGNAGYQTYLVTLRQVEAAQAVGVAQASALQKAEIKVFANTGDAPSGLSSIGELLGSKGGQQVGAFLESLSATSESAERVIGKATNGARNVQ